MLKINSQRLWDLLDRFADFGRTPNNGVTRLTLSDEDKRARDELIRLAQQAGFCVKIDAIGNIFIRRKGKNPTALPVLIGSHIDSQPQGGRFDGIYGVLAGLEVLLTLNDLQIETEHPIDLVSWTNEEGARFAPAMMGAAVFSEKLALTDTWAKLDSKGISVKQALEQIGYLGNDDVSQYQAKAALEIHIEQGPVLEKNDKDIGIVTGALGQNWYQIQFEGLASHAGTTPMNMRQDAGLGMAKAMVALNQLGWEEIPAQGRVTVGRILLEPNSPNVIPDKAYFTLEVRHPDKVSLERIDQQVHSLLQNIAEENQLKVSIKQVVQLSPLQFDANLQQDIESAVKKLGYSYQPIISGAGHDSCHLNSKFPTAMIFIPCIDGLSHNEAENIKPEWSEKGGNVLLNTVVKLAC